LNAPFEIAAHDVAEMLFSERVALRPGLVRKAEAQVHKDDMLASARKCIQARAKRAAKSRDPHVRKY
jgi:hypothetical protein